MNRKKRSDWQEISQSIQSVYETEVAKASRRRSLWAKLVAGLIGLVAVTLIFYPTSRSKLSTTEEVEPIQEELVLEQVEPEEIQDDSTEAVSLPDDTEQELLKLYRAKKDEYVFNWDVEKFEALKDSFSMSWDDEEGPITLKEVVEQHGKPSLLRYEDGWVYVTYTEKFVERLIDGLWGYSPRVELNFKLENDDWFLKFKSMDYIVSDDIQQLIDQAPSKSYKVEGTNQKVFLKDLVSPLRVGQISSGQGGSSLEETLELLGRPSGYGFRSFGSSSRDVLSLAYEDIDTIYLTFRLQEDGSYLLSKRE